MALQGCSVTLDVNVAALGADALDVTLAYRAVANGTNGSRAAWVYAAPTLVNADAFSVSITVARLRPFARYEAKALTMRIDPADGAIAPVELCRGSFTSAATGVAAFDDGPIANVAQLRDAAYGRGLL